MSQLEMTYPDLMAPGGAVMGSAPDSIWLKVLGGLAVVGLGVGVGWMLKSAMEKSDAEAKNKADMDSLMATLPKTPAQKLVDRANAIIAGGGVPGAPPIPVAAPGSPQDAVNKVNAILASAAAAAPK